MTAPDDIAALAAGLTSAQRAAMLDISDPGQRYSRFGWGSSCTNPTASALERRGLARVEFDRSKSCAGFPWSRWVPTPLGLSIRQHLLDKERG